MSGLAQFWKGCIALQGSYHLDEPLQEHRSGCINLQLYPYPQGNSSKIKLMIFVKTLSTEYLYENFNFELKKEGCLYSLRSSEAFKKVPV